MPDNGENKPFIYWTPVNHQGKFEWLLGCYLELALLNVVFFFTFFTIHTTQIPYFGNYYTCPFKDMTGLSCPGCGITRAFIAVGHGHLITALKSNPLILLFFPIFLLRFTQRIQEILFKGFYAVRFNGKFLLLIAIIIFSFGITRMILQILNITPVV
jgi:hypothetical protein